MRVVFRTSSTLLDNIEAIKDVNASDSLIMHSAPDIVAYLKHNIICTLEAHHELAHSHHLLCDSLVSRTHYQTLGTTFFRKRQVYNFQFFLTRKLSTCIPFQPDIVAIAAIDLVKYADSVPPQFIVFDCSNLLVDCWCLQERFGINTTRILCGHSRESMSHLLCCPIAMQIRQAIIDDDESDNICKFYNAIWSRQIQLHHPLFLSILRTTIDSIRQPGASS
jgi:hypothetical protein